MGNRDTHTAPGFTAWIYAGLAALCSCDATLPPDVALAYEQLPSRVDYNYDVKPVLSDKCFVCHGPDPDNREAGLRLDFPEAAFATLPENPGKVAIDPGNWRRSEEHTSELQSLMHISYAGFCL